MPFENNDSWRACLNFGAQQNAVNLYQNIHPNICSKVAMKIALIGRFYIRPQQLKALSIHDVYISVSYFQS